MTEPLISICIPTYNGERYLKECLDSCINQTYPNYEIVICDDGSNDGTEEIIASYLNEHKTIRFFKNAKNLGLVGNWNHCINLAEGTWIKFLFQDDVMATNCLQVFYENITPETRLITCKRNFMLAEKVSVEKKEYYANTVRTLENTGHYHSAHFSAQAISQIAAANLSLNFIAEPSLTLFKRDLIRSVGMFDPELKQICDLEFFLRVASNFGLTYIPKKLCGFRIHDHSTTEKNITGTDYRLHYLETLRFTIRLTTGKEFANFRKAISPLQTLKLKWYIKYKSYVAFTNIASTNDADLFNELKQTYGHLFFKNYERLLLNPVQKIQAARQK